MIMKEISLHVLDIVQNSISAGAKLVSISVDTENEEDMMRIVIDDDGCGMDEETAARVLSPFATSRTTRKVGLGIPFFKEAAEGCGGSFALTSSPGVGTRVYASFRLSNIDRPPLGDMAETMLTLTACNENVDFVYRYTVDKTEFVFDTRQIREILGADIALTTPDVMAWMKGFLSQGIQELSGGA